MAPVVINPGPPKDVIQSPINTEALGAPQLALYQGLPGINQGFAVPKALHRRTTDVNP